MRTKNMENEFLAKYSKSILSFFHDDATFKEEWHDPFRDHFRRFDETLRTFKNNKKIKRNQI